MGISFCMSSGNPALQGSVSYLLRRCQQHAADLFAAEAGAGDLTPRQLTVLIALEALGAASQTDLVVATGIDRSTLADMVSRMTAKDLIARKRLETDARANQIKLTAKGARLMKAHQAALKKTDAALLAAIPAAQRAAFMKGLTALAAVSTQD